MTYYEYHDLLLNEVVIDLKMTLKQKFRFKSPVPLHSVLNIVTDDGYSTISVKVKYDKVNNLLISGKVKANDEVDFEALGF